MISSASLFALVGALLGVSDTTAPTAAAHQVRVMLASRWGVAESTVVLAWGQWPADTGRFATARAQFPGSPDREGWLAVVFTPDSGSPVSVRLRAGVRTPTLVAARALDPGHVLEDSDFTFHDLVRWGTGTSPSSVAQVGWEVRRAMREGEPFAANSTVAPMGVRAGETVRLCWERGQVRIEIEAVAVGQARIGETVRARKGEVQYTGIITAPGIARLGGASS